MEKNVELQRLKVKELQEVHTSIKDRKVIIIVIIIILLL